MKKMLFGVMAAALTSVAMAQEAAPEAAPATEKNPLIPAIEINLKYASAYMSDGKIVNPESMLFGDLCLSWDITEDFGIYAGIWVANDWNDYNEGTKGDHIGGVEYEPEEIDYYAGAWYTLNDLAVVKSLTFDFSYTYWDMPQRTGWNHPGCTKQKAALTVTTGEFKFADDNLSITPGINVNVDPENEEWQVKPFVNAGYAITDKISANTSVELFWENAKSIVGRCNHSAHPGYARADVDKNALTTLVWSADVSYAITENISVGPFGKLAWCLDHDFREEWKAEGSDNMKSGCNTLWGVQMNLSF